MPNYFTDNKNLVSHFSSLQLYDVVSFLENSYQQNADRVDGTEVLGSLDEAMELYESALALCGDIAANYIAPRAASIDAEGTKLIDGEVQYSKATLEVQKCLAESGFMGIILPRKFGGLNFPATIYTMMIELVSQADASMMTMFGYQDVGEAVAHLASAEVAMSFLPEYCEGKKIGAMVLTEPGGGSDLQSVRVKAEKDTAGRWYLSGVKQFISHGNGDLLLVLARSEEGREGMFGLSLFVVQGGKENGVSVARIEEKMGLHGSPTCELHFDQAEGFLVGKQTSGLFHVIDILNHARFSVAAQALGIAQGAYNDALKYAKEREAFGKVIYDIPQVADMLMDMSVQLASCRALLYAGTQYLDRRNCLHQQIKIDKNNGSKPSTKQRVALKKAQQSLDLLSPLVKYIVTENSTRICHMAQQVFGGSGYITEYQMERRVRDVRITTIYEGTTQIQIGLAIKPVIANVLADEIAFLDNDGFTQRLHSSVDKLICLREIYITAVDVYQQSTNAFFKGAAAVELTNMYGALFAGVLLLKRAMEDDTEIPLMSRFVATALANSRAGIARIEEGVYTDGANRDLICGS